MPENNPVWQRAILLDKYYEKVGLAAIGEGGCPRFVSFEAGYGLLDYSAVVEPDDLPVIEPIPRDMASVPGSFFSGAITGEYAAGKLTLSGVIPAGGVSTPQLCSLVGIFDQDGDLVAMCASLPDWVAPNEIYKTYPIITLPMEITENG
jgi:hypothetical protein